MRYIQSKLIISLAFAINITWSGYGYYLLNETYATY